jgi:hypothetical protein
VLVVVMRTMFALVVAAMLVTGIVGGLLRAGVAVPVPGDGAWPGRAVLGHAFLMMCAFMGTVIGIERAVALKERWAFAAPGVSALAGVLMLVGMPRLATWLAVLASVVFIAANVAVVSRQTAAHTVLLLTGATTWLVGNLLHALGAHAAAVIPWWFSFLVLTIAAERLEMTRLMRRRSGAAAALYVCLGLMLGGSAAFALSPIWGGGLYGLALTGLAAWLVCFDIARRTVASHGLSRYMAVCLLGGYAWLAVAGIAWVANAWGVPARDIALHALGLGFVVGMAMGHAPVILPAIARIKLLFGPWFYAPVALLHASLALRAAAAIAGGPELRATAAALNAAALALFVLTIVASALAWHARSRRMLIKRTSQ